MSTILKDVRMTRNQHESGTVCRIADRSDRIPVGSQTWRIADVKKRLGLRPAGAAARPRSKLHLLFVSAGLSHHLRNPVEPVGLDVDAGDVQECGNGVLHRAVKERFDDVLEGRLARLVP
jgi:hypothetical protein